MPATPESVQVTLINADATLNLRLENNWKMGQCHLICVLYKCLPAPPFHQLTFPTSSFTQDASPHRQHLIHQQYLSIHMRRHRKRQPYSNTPKCREWSNFTPGEWMGMSAGHEPGWVVVAAGSR